MPSSEPAPGDAPGGDRRRRDTRRRLLAAAAERFAEKGYAATSVAEIEQAVGLRPGAGGLYRHFASKEALLVAVVEGYRDRLSLVRQTLAALPADDAVATQLERVCLALVAFLADERAVVRIGAELAALPARARLVIGQAWDEAHGAFADVFERAGVAPGRAAALGVAALGELAHYLEHERTFGSPPLGVSLGTFLASWQARWARVVEEETTS
ncbi:TetR/AcrR family transcriptional regulator [Aciditerrimonas ferrireducens]|uniref:TetR/AcrR family transcriptional regulator n=1 Tax=Aciditerrimonas ferrireducens TaxID=667306 RepID=UPI002005582C|nr:TetR/AcrR family transcriptional regulator [Aciditerrimonas ferrireducens]MCK4177169.1 TetR/AcrR family transcriptional regulator [Aciditerrimonas ferrireducens]